MHKCSKSSLRTPYFARLLLIIVDIVNEVNYLEIGTEHFLDIANTYSIHNFISFEIASGGSLQDLINDRKSNGSGGFSEIDAADIIW